MTDPTPAEIRAAIERLVEAVNDRRGGHGTIGIRAIEARPAMSALAGCCVLDVETVRVLAQIATRVNRADAGDALGVSRQCLRDALAAAEAELARVEGRSA